MSCHGIQDRRGRLHFAASNTRRDRLAGTAVEAAFVNAQFENSFAGGRVVMLDCCFSGSFASGFVGKSALGSPLAGEVGRGYVVLTATDAFEYAFEGRNLTLNEPQPSLFTDAIARGLTVPEADRDRDGWISTTDLYDYVYSDVARRAEQKPGYFAIGVEGKILLSRVVHSSGPRGGAPESSPAIRIEAPYLGDG